MASKAPWFSKMTSQMGPVIAVLFVLLFFFWQILRFLLGPLANIQPALQEASTQHNDLLHEMRVSTHFLWADCINAAETPQERSRCIPPIEITKETVNSEGYHYMQEIVESVLSSNDDPPPNEKPLEKINNRDAEERSVIQSETRLENLEDKGLNVPPEES